VIAVALTVSKFFSLPLIIRNKSFAVSLPVSGNAAAIISARKSLPIRCTGKSRWTVHRSGAERTPATGSNIASTILRRPHAIASGSNAVTKSAAW
jgi:hypothetical protein